VTITAKKAGKKKREYLLISHLRSRIKEAKHHKLVPTRKVALMMITALNVTAWGVQRCC